jgi:hypothetical protein
LRTIALDRGVLGFATPERCNELLPGFDIPDTPSMPAVSLMSGDMQASRAFFASCKIPLLFDRDTSFCIHPHAAAGAALVLHTPEESWLLRS